MERLPASITSLHAFKCGCGHDCIVTTGLCNTLRAWSKKSDGEWRIVLSVDNCKRLPKGRSTSHPFRFVVNNSDYLAVASSEPDSRILIYCTSTWAAHAELSPAEDFSGTTTSRFTPASLVMQSRHLACGSREGSVALWRLENGDEFEPCGGALLRADEGPVGSLALDEDRNLLVVGHITARGSVDGATFEGMQSVAAWSLDGLQLLWRTQIAPGLPSPLPPPTLALLHQRKTGSAWLLHAHSRQADGEWPQFASASEAVESSATTALLQQVVQQPSTETAVQSSSSLPHREPLARVLSWHAAEDGSALAIGFAGGRVALFSLSAEGPPRLYWGETPEAIGDVGAVAILPPSLALEAGAVAAFQVEDAKVPFVLAGTASSTIQLWRAEAKGADDAKLNLLLNLVVPIQVSALSVLSTGVVCGGADGSIVCLRSLYAQWISDHCAPDSTTGYVWTFSMSGGNTCSVEDKREVFNGWARTADYERGLTDLLLGNAAPSKKATEDANGAAAAAVVTPSSIRLVTSSRWRLPAAFWSLRRHRSLGRCHGPGRLPPPELAVRSRVVRVRKQLSLDEIADVLRLSEQLPFGRKHPDAARSTCYLSTGGAFGKTMPHLRERLLDVARKVDAKQRWGLLKDRTVAPRCVECHKLAPGKDVLHPGHYDYGSVLTVMAMLSQKGEFEGGAFQTAEADGSVRKHDLDCGDCLVFVSHKPHFVAGVTSGERRCLIVEFWEGDERTCPHRCEVRSGPCLARVRSSA